MLLINYQSHNFDDAETSLLKVGFVPILTKTMFTYLIFNKTITQDRLSLSNNWRHNLKRANKNDDLEIEWVSSYEDREKVYSHLSEMYEKLRERKNLKQELI